MTNTGREKPSAEPKPYEEYSEKTGYPVVKKTRKKFKLESLRMSEVPWAWVCVACLLVALVLVIVFPVFEEKQKDQFILALEKRVAALERRLDQYQEGAALMQRMDFLETGINDVRGRLFTQEQKLSEGFDRISTAQQQKESKIPPKPEAVNATGAEATRYHEVTPGETLFRISRRYGVSVEHLRQLNGLSESSLIHPGQKLIVSSP